MLAKSDEVRKSTRRSASGMESTPKQQDSISSTGSMILDKIMHAKDQDGDLLATAFLRLPSRKQYPEYYAVIKRPITLTEIRTKLKQGTYQTLQELRQDLDLVCNNAKRFNEREMIKEAWSERQEAQQAAQDPMANTPEAKRRRLAESVAKSSLSKDSAQETPSKQTQRPSKITLRRNHDSPSKTTAALPTDSRSVSSKDTKPASKIPTNHPGHPTSSASKTSSMKDTGKSSSQRSETKPEPSASDSSPSTTNHPSSAAGSTPKSANTNATNTSTKEANGSSARAEANMPPVTRVVSSPYTSPSVPKPVQTTSPYVAEPRRRGAPRGKRLRVMLRWAIQSMTSAQNPQGTSFAEMFMELPSRQDYPDYYQLIQYPISFAEIDQKLEQKEYINPHALVTDIYRMLSNAQYYNEEHSQVWDDAQALRSHLEKVVIPTLLAEGFTLDPNDHRQAALPPGTPGAVPWPPSSPAPDNLSEKSSPAPVHVNRTPNSAIPLPPSTKSVELSRASPSLNTATAPILRPTTSSLPTSKSVNPITTPTSLSTRPNELPPSTQGPKLNTAVAPMTLEQVVRLIENKTWPQHPALLQIPQEAISETPAPPTNHCPVRSVRMQMYPDTEPTEYFAEIGLTCDEKTLPQVIRIPRRCMSMVVRLSMDHRDAIRVALNRREVGGAWIENETLTYAFHINLERGFHTLEVSLVSSDSLEKSKQGQLRLYLNK
ncbi:hypothetical protein MPSI1_003285 [Malassezia psittaci]|uniref:Bromo domain-containing protein n=1 Tax=Malassezia psittaci TaxID=1821823 RepID=A0AAF0FHG8_9BASI|nr:hypothetical protein MPSI1_003285 [Malassezia psittaci]